MDLLLTGGSVFRNGKFEQADVAVSDGRIVSISPNLPHGDAVVVEVNGCFLVPGFVDVHVHLREPGFSYKETIATGTAAAAAGGYTAVCAMPNLKPVPDSAEHLAEQLEIISRDACVRVYPYGAITVGQKGQELADLSEMRTAVCGYSDDGHGVQAPDMMRTAMTEAKRLGRPIVAHCEDESLLTKWAIHDGEYARLHNLPGNNPESEWRQVERDINLVRETGCQYHVCHISTKESAALVRAAKAEGLPVTCETGPHYLTLTDMELQDDGRFKMNPPIRTAEDQDALIAALLDGTIDCIATDHAPHSAEEKGKGLLNSANGVVGLETAFPVVYTKLVKTGIVPLEVVLDRLCIRPRKIFNLPGGVLEAGEIADLTVIDPNYSYTVDPAKFRSMGKASPFAGWKLDCAVAMTIVDGKIVYKLDKEETL